jgi:hypothetical protein
MKYQKTLAVLAGLAFAGAFSQAQIAIGENLTVSGFVDASYSNTDSDTAADDDTSIGVNEVEIDFAFSYEGVSAEVHLQSEGGDVELEQAFVTTDLSGITISAGRMLSLLGFEADEPTGLYQVSRAYDATGNDAGKSYNEGIRAAASQGDFSVAASVTDGLYDATAVGAEGDADDTAFDILVSYSGIENLSISLGYADDGNGDTQVVNIYATYVLGQLTLAGEYSDWDDNGTESDNYLILANYSLNDDTSITVRRSEVCAATPAADFEKTTVALNYSISDNLSSVIEYSDSETAGADSDTIAVKGIFSF